MEYGRWIIGWSIDLLIMIVIFKNLFMLNNKKMRCKMTDKEEIIIDGVNVGQCKYLNTFTDCDGYHYYCDLADDIKNEYCEHYKNCYFKQLQKEKFENLNNRQMVESAENLIYENSELYKNIKEKKREDRYHKALEEIEKVINNILNSCLGRNTAGCRPTHNVCGDLIKNLDIINEVKDGSNEN